MAYYELNIDGLVGPSHNYAGLSAGNLASTKNIRKTSYPKQAALQGLKKMRALHQLGYKQAFIPPAQRPSFQFLKQLGFSGNSDTILKGAIDDFPQILPTLYSASSMWAANAATVTSALESKDGRIHFTPANLHSTLHRSLEHLDNYAALKTIFPDESYFAVHDALPSHSFFSDEGAANHLRICESYESAGVNIFVYGKTAENATKKYPARQSLHASKCIARQHLCEHNTYFLQQNPIAIDAGAFHNDVVSVSNGPVLLYHQLAFDKKQQEHVFSHIRDRVPSFMPICIHDDEITFNEAIRSYFFNSQLLSHPDGSCETMHLIAPTECKDSSSVRQCIDNIIQDSSNPINDVSYFNLKQSMQNGGGPACLRLRVPISEAELKAVDARFLLDDHKFILLENWVNTHYRDEIRAEDLCDPNLARECIDALDGLTKTMSLGNYYSFQR